MDNKQLLFMGVAAGSALLTPAISRAQYSPNAPFKGRIGKTVAETVTDYPAHNPVAREGAPNVVWILLDDTGFGTTSAFGGLIETPTFDYLAENGLRFNNFHSAAISAATRACLLTGRNHHNCHMGRFNDDRYGTPGYDTYLPMENGTIAEILRENGYATFCVGKYNGAPEADGSFAGPFNRWPLGRGFDHHYGFSGPSGGEDQWHPKMYRDTHREPDDSLGQLCITRLANEAINYIAEQQSAAPDQPFFLYFCPGTSHTPFHTSADWVEKYRGRFDDGWHEYARKTHARQLEMGVIPQGTPLPIMNADVEIWEDLPEHERRLFARQMETFAGFLSQADYEIGRIVEFLRRIGELDNTLIVLALGDNGASGEGYHCGNRYVPVEKEKAYIANELTKLDHYGDERTFPFYPTGWAQACNTPFRYYKKWADYEGGTHDGLIVFYPKGIRETGGLRTQYTHATDILPTTVELTGSRMPKRINGYKQAPVEGTSFAYAVTSADNNITDRKKMQTFELNASYALYLDGWKVQFPNGKVNGLRFSYPDTLVHLYNLREDFNESNDLAAQYPRRVRKMLRIFRRYARKNNIYPLKDGKLADEGRFPNPTRPHYDIFLGARNYGEYAYFDGTRGRPYSISVYIDEAGAHPEGVLMSNNTFAFYVKDGVPVYAIRDEAKKIVSSKPLPQGACTVKADISFAGKKMLVKLFIDDEQVAEGKFGQKMGLPGKSNYIQVGRQWGVPVNDDYASPAIFTGKIFKGCVDVGTISTE